MTTQATAAAPAASISAESSLPLLKSEKTWGALAVFGNTSSAAVATWCFITGGFVAYYLAAGKGSVAIAAGTLIGVFIVLVAALPASTRYGVEAVRSSRPLLGARGSSLTVALMFLVLVGWNSVLTISLGRAAAAALVTMGVLPEGSALPAQVVGVLVSLVVVALLLRRGTRALRWAGPAVAIAVLVLATAITVILLTQFGLDRIFAAEPLGATGNTQTDFMIVVELGIAGGVSWWPYVGSLTRNATTPAPPSCPASSDSAR